MRGCLLKCSSEQVRNATDAEWLGAELSGTLATELLNSRQRSGQRGVRRCGTEEPSVDTRSDTHQVGPLAPIPEDTEVVNAEIPHAMETGLQTRPRQPESEPGSEPGERNVGPRVGSESNEPRMDGDQERQPSTDNEGEVLQWAAVEQCESSVRRANDQCFTNLVVPANIRQHVYDISIMCNPV